VTTLQRLAVVAPRLLQIALAQCHMAKELVRLERRSPITLRLRTIQSPTQKLPSQTDVTPLPGAQRSLKDTNEQLVC
jgi:hypothetical protein